MTPNFRPLRIVLLIISLACAATLIFATLSCRKVPIHGWPDGMWQVQLIEFADGSSVATPGIYYCFELHTAQVKILSRGTYTANMTFDRETQILSLQFPRATAEQLRPAGIDDPICTFRFAKWTGQQLVMTNDFATITMRKF